MKFCATFFNIICSHYVVGQLMHDAAYNLENQRTYIIVDIINQNYKNNGWSTIICCGALPDEFFYKLSNIAHPFAIINVDDSEDVDIGEVFFYYSNIIIISLQNIAEYEKSISKVKSSPYWHPLANVILYYHDNDKTMVGKLFFSLWFHRAINAIIVQYDDTREMLDISYYTPYTCDNYKLDHHYGCWTTRKIGMPVFGFDEGLTCEKECHNVTQHSKLKANNLGTCISYSTIRVPYNDTTILSMDLFPDKAKNFHGYPMRSYANEIFPPLLVDELENGTYRLHARDGILWNTLAQVMNFTIDLSPCKDVIKSPFNFETSINMIFDFSHRKVDLFLMPIYLFDLVIVEIDFSFPIMASGVCIMSHRSGFETTLFSSKSLYVNINMVAQFTFCFISIWIVFSIYQTVERGHFSFDQLGKDLMNAFRNVLLITLYNPPRRYNSFRIFLSISIWSFFLLNFATQATIISFLTAFKRGKDVETFEDIIEKGYLIYGMASPDLILPDDEEKFRRINSKLVAVHDLYSCVRKMSYDRQRFCLIDCTVGRFVAKNNLNEQGEQYLHIAQDRMHSHSLALIHIRNSPLTQRFDKYLMSFYEAGLISKWEQYRYTDIKEDAPVKQLGMDDLRSLFNLYFFLIGVVSLIFVTELIIFHLGRLLKPCSLFKNKRRVD